MKDSKMTEAGRLARNAYQRKYTKANRKRIAEINERYWSKKAKKLK